MSKSELYKAYVSKGPHAMYCDIMSDQKLRPAAELIVRISNPLHLKYAEDLETQQQGSTAILEWNACRALGGSMPTVTRILYAQSSSELCSAMRISSRCRPPLPYDAVNLEDDITLVQKASDFAVNLAANFAWSEQFPQLTLPLAAASLLSQDPVRRKIGMKHLKRLVTAITRAEMQVKKQPELEQVLKTLAFQEETLAREVMTHLSRGQFKLDSSGTRDCIQVMTELCSGTSSTMELLESTFAHLSYIVSGANKNKVTSPAALWIYASASPYVAKSGMHQSLPTEAEWVRATSDFGKSKQEMYQLFSGAFKSAKTDLPSAPDVHLPRTSKGLVKTEWRLSGPASHYKSSAAAAYLLFDAPNFANASFAWAGVFLQRGCFFYDTVGDQFFLSLGFQQWAALGVEMNVMNIAGKEYLTFNTENEDVHFLHNFSFDETCKWRYVSHRILPPACLPDALPVGGTAFEVLDRDQWIARGALQSGLNLTIERLRNVCTAVKCKLPQRGTGKGGRIKKIDIVRALVNHLWPDESEDFVKDIVRKMMGESKGDFDISVLAMVSGLDTEDQESFERMKQDAMKQLEKKLYGQGVEAGLQQAKKQGISEQKAASDMKEKADATAAKLTAEKEETDKSAAMKQWNLTPPELRQLLPGNGSISDTKKLQSCQRSFPTNQCPKAIDALSTVLNFAYNRWNELNPNDKYEMFLAIDFVFGLCFVLFCVF
ncbi:Uncharacterized protein SCF082_LOCUS36698 [Durusdinium trenchii]|uniref:Uncharacterized protein n=1 Tax=Durusdinium trenchii TaxID=1381693 RepID=A0ABP0PJX7_9DINO